MLRAPYELCYERVIPNMREAKLFLGMFVVRDG
jgi:hypothetical protein